MGTETMMAELPLRARQRDAGRVIADLAMDDVPVVWWHVNALDTDSVAFPTLDGQADCLSTVEAYAARWDVPVVDRFAGRPELGGRTYGATTQIRGIHVRVWVRLSDEEAEHRRAIAEEEEREAEEAAADWAWATGIDGPDVDELGARFEAEQRGAEVHAAPEVPAAYGAGVVVPCSCGVGDERTLGHDELCKGSVAVADHIACAGVVGVTDGALTVDERSLIEGVANIVRDRLGQRGGTKGDIDLGRLGRSMIRSAASEICGVDIPPRS